MEKWSICSQDDDDLDRDHFIIELNNECGNGNSPTAAMRYGDYKVSCNRTYDFQNYFSMYYIQITY